MTISPETLPAIRATYVPNPFSSARNFCELEDGQSITQILIKIQPDPWYRSQACVSIDGIPIPPEKWDETFPKKGTLLVIRCFPSGGRHGVGKVFRVILSIFVAIAAIAVSILLPGALGFLPGTLGAALVGGLGGAITGIVGNLIINALIPPANPRKALDSAVGLQGPTVYGITGSQNQISHGAVPRLLGTLRTMPLKAAWDWSEIFGINQWVRCLFTLGFGPVKISEPRIGSTDLSKYIGVEIEYRNIEYNGITYGNDPFTLYSTLIREESFTIKLGSMLPPVKPPDYIRTTQRGINGISIDITAPQGVMNEEVTKGFNQGWAINLNWYYRKHRDDGIEDPWITIAETTQWIASKSAWRYSMKTPFDINPTKDPNLAFDVKVVNMTTPAVTDVQVWDLYWSAMRVYKPKPPYKFPHPLAAIALRVLATDQLNGTVSTFSCLTSSILPDWDPPTQTWITRATNNPASLYLEVLSGIAAAKPVPLNRIYMPQIQHWHEYCTAKGYTYNKNIDAETSQFNLLREIAAAGRAAPSEYDSKYSVVLEEEQAAPAEIFTTRNSWGLSVSLLYPDLPHGLRVSFVNEQNDYQNDERFVLDDGYQIDDLDAWGVYHPEYQQATLFEQLELPGVTNPDNVFKLARYHLAAARLRPRLISFSCDYEHLAVTRGDLIHYQHDVLLVGLGSSRISQIVMNTMDGIANFDVIQNFDTEIVGDKTASFVTEDFLTVEANVSHSCRFRTPNLSSITKQVPLTTVPGLNVNRFYLSDWIPDTDEVQPQNGDLFLLGESGKESIPLLVRSIQTTGDLSATLTCVDQSPGIHVADVGLIPPFVSGRTVPSEWSPPKVVNIRSDLSVAIPSISGPIINMEILVEANSFFGIVKDNLLQCQYWPTDRPNEKRLVSSTDLIRIDINPVETGTIYSFQVKYSSNDSPFALWSEVYQHKVVGLSVLPDVANLVDVYRDNQTVLIWDSAFDYRLGLTIIGYEVRKGTTWENGQVIGLVKDPTFPIMGDGVYWVAVRVNDKYSPNPTSIEIIGANLPVNVLVSQDEYTVGWTGTKTDTVINAGYLELKNTGLFDSAVSIDGLSDWDLDTQMPPVGYYETQELDVGITQPCRIYSSLIAVSRDLFDIIDNYPDFDAITNIDGFLSGATSVIVQMAMSGNDGIFGDWKTLIPGTFNGRKFKFRLVLSSFDVHVTPVVESFIWTIDMPDRIESGTYDLGTGGNTISYSRAFQAVPAPQITIYSATAGDEIFLTAKTVSGFTCQVKNGGTGVARTIHWIVKGY